jgi:hypothetical protein
MKTQATIFAETHCRLSRVASYECYAVKLAKLELAALASLTNYYEVVELIPSELSAAEQVEFTTAIKVQCVLLARQALVDVKPIVNLR